MNVNPINNENRNISVPKAGVLGAALGYAATYIVPLTTEEHNNYFTESVKQNIKDKAKAARGAEIGLIEEELKNGNIQPLVKDVFEKSKDALADSPKKVLKELQTAEIDKSAKKSLTSFFKRVNNTGKMVQLKETALTSLAAKKDSRSAIYGAVIGAFGLMSIAVLKNALNTFLPSKEAKKPVAAHQMSDLDYIIDCAEGPAAIYIAGFGKNNKKA